jgi:hypothetical protein
MIETLSGRAKRVGPGSTRALSSARAVARSIDPATRTSTSVIAAIFKLTDLGGSPRLASATLHAESVIASIIAPDIVDRRI